MRSVEDARIRNALSDPALRDWSNVYLGRLLKVAPSTIGQVRTEMQRAGEIPTCPRLKYIDGGGLVRWMRVSPARARRRTADVRASAREKRAFARGYREGLAAGLTQGKGIDAGELHQLAGEILDQDRQHKRSVAAMLRHARAVARSVGANLATIHLQAARGLDAAAIRGLDDVAASMASTYPEHFRDGLDSHEQQLFDMLVAGAPKPMSVDKAYERATAYLARNRWPAHGSAAA
jgi:hypothetical protein